MYSTTKIKLPRSNTFRLQKVFYRLQHIYRKHLIQKENFQTGIITAQFVALIQVQLPGADLLWQSTSQIKAWFQYTGKKKERNQWPAACRKKWKCESCCSSFRARTALFCVFLFLLPVAVRNILRKKRMLSLIVEAQERGEKKGDVAIKNRGGLDTHQFRGFHRVASDVVSRSEFELNFSDD